MKFYIVPQLMCVRCHENLTVQLAGSKDKFFVVHPINECTEANKIKIIEKATLLKEI